MAQDPQSSGSRGRAGAVAIWGLVIAAVGLVLAFFTFFGLDRDDEGQSTPTTATGATAQTATIERDVPVATTVQGYLQDRGDDGSGEASMRIESLIADVLTGRVVASGPQVPPPPQVSPQRARELVGSLTGLTVKATVRAQGIAEELRLTATALDAEGNPRTPEGAPQAAELESALQIFSGGLNPGGSTFRAREAGDQTVATSFFICGVVTEPITLQLTFALAGVPATEYDFLPLEPRDCPANALPTNEEEEEAFVRRFITGLVAWTCGGSPATIVGTEGAETLPGTPGDDVIVALDGDDFVTGSGGNDIVCLGAGNDRLVSGGPGVDRIFGEDGNDRMDGGAGENLFDGGEGRDTCRGTGVSTSCEL